MSCTPTLAAFSPGCNNVSGIKQLYIIDKAAREDAGITISVTNGAGTIAGTGASAYLWKPLQNNFSLTQPVTQSNNDGTSYVTQTLTGVLHGYSAALVYLMGELRKGRNEAVCELRDGTFVYVGLDYPGLQISGGDGGASGQAIGDPKGATVELTCESASEAPTITFSEFEAAFTIVEP